MWISWAGVHVARGNASKVFHPFLLPGDFKGSSEDLRNKVLVNFDPLSCFVGDLEASIIQCLDFYLFIIISIIIKVFGRCCNCSRPLFFNVERVLKHFQAMV